jgi:hypothetical protein
LALPLYAATLFVSAFILFLVQPMIGKMILPKLGGTPQVWNTCMVFFQTILLAGYAYTHFVSTRLRLKQQLMLHGILILLPFLVLLPWKTWGLPLPEGPFNLTDWAPDLGVNPIPSALYILLVIVGLPFFVVSTTAPLLQKWFSATGHPAASDPYFLYGASNLGSMLGLLFYPTIIEPNLVLRNQALLFTAGFALLVVTVYMCIGLVWKPAVTPPGEAPPPSEGVPNPPVVVEKPETGITAKAPVATAVRAGAPKPAIASVSLGEADQVTTWRRLKWVALAAVPSSMMLGITTHITTDLSPVPMIWLIPLTLYLLSFILVFARWPVVWVEEPHKIMVFLQPFFIMLMLLSDFMNWGHSYLKAAIFFDVAGFFFTTMVCHGELAKDRPTTRYLTEFYLMMSIGGMLGGMFNGLFAPNIPYLFEFPAAIIAACLLRPALTQAGWIAEFVAGMIDTSAGEGGGKKGKHRGPTHAQVTPKLAITVDIVLAVGLGILSFVLYQVTAERGQETPTSIVVGYGLPLIVTVSMLFRPLRYGLAVAAIILVHAIVGMINDRSDYRVRGYFGLIQVRTGALQLGTYKNMIHGHIDHGMNFQKPRDDKIWGDPRKDFSRLATTYYHRLGPAGVVMERFCWFKEGENEFTSDSRIGAAMTGLGGPLMGSTLPVEQIANLWSEPAFATIGLGTGTMASYARPYQHCHYYEIDNNVKRLSLRTAWPANVDYLFFRDPTDPTRWDSSQAKAPPQFTYLRDALARGAHVQVLMGDARLRMNMPYETKKGSGFYADPEFSGGPERFYHMMVVDAFSSDAIPAHLITKQAIEMYFKHLTEEGILCVHTSNRFVDLVKVVADVTADLGYACRRGHDSADEREKGHYTSEWVMVARKDAYLKHLREPPNFREIMRARKQALVEPYWSTPEPEGRYVWTDDFYNILGVLR